MCDQAGAKMFDFGDIVDHNIIKCKWIFEGWGRGGLVAMGKPNIHL